MSVRALSGQALGNKTGWVFDLDNTLYPAECDLFAQIDVRMSEYVARALSIDVEAARITQKQYLVEHGTTLNGLMTVNGLDPGPYLDYVHDIDLSPVAPDPELARLAFHQAVTSSQRLLRESP